MNSMENYSYSITFVDDGSSDATLRLIKELAEEHGPSAIRYLSFSRNFGKEAAILAGLSASSGDCSVLMDCDLQDPPQLLPQMLKALEEGYDSCATRRRTRSGEPRLRSFFAASFYRLMNSVASVDLEPGARDYRMMNRAFREAIVALGERERFYKGLSAWVGFSTKWLEYENEPRHAGATKWSFWGLMRYATGGILSFSSAPLGLGLVCGGLMLLAAVVLGSRAVLHALSGAGVSDAILLATLVLGIGGVLALLLGIIGLYLGTILGEIKRRPVYLIRETNI